MRIHIMFVGNMTKYMTYIYIYMFMWYKIAFLLSYYFFYCDRIEEQNLFLFGYSTTVTTGKGCIYLKLWYFTNNYSTGVQIVSCTLSDDSVLSQNTGLFNPVLCVSQWNLFWQQNQPIRLCLSNQVRHGGKLFPSPLGDFNRLFEGLIWELFKIWRWNMFYFF